MLQCEASVKVRSKNIFAWPLEHTRHGPYLVVTKKLYDQVSECFVDKL